MLLYSSQSEFAQYSPSLHGIPIKVGHRVFSKGFRSNSCCVMHHTAHSFTHSLTLWWVSDSSTRFRLTCSIPLFPEELQQIKRWCSLVAQRTYVVLVCAMCLSTKPDGTKIRTLTTTRSMHRDEHKDADLGNNCYCSCSELYLGIDKAVQGAQTEDDVVGPRLFKLYWVVVVLVLLLLLLMVVLTSYDEEGGNSCREIERINSKRHLNH